MNVVSMVGLCLQGPPTELSMQRASRQRIALALIFCLVDSGLLSSAPRSITRTPGHHEVLPAGWQFGSPLPRAPLGRPGGGAPLAASPFAAPAQQTPPSTLRRVRRTIVAENCLPGDHQRWDVIGAAIPVFRASPPTSA